MELEAHERIDLTLYQRLSYHYSFHCRDCVCGLDYTLTVALGVTALPV